MRVLVYGLGRSGLAAARLVAAQGHEVRWFERREEGEDVAAAHAAGWPRCRAPVTCSADLCIAAPGVPIDHPDLVALRARGIETIGEVEWVHRSVDAPMVGVTGTAGKGTVTRWIETMLRAGGIDAVAGGNVDPALSAVAAPGRWLVAELSSFQLERCPTLAPEVAVIVNLGFDHLDRHGSVAAYHGAKRALVAHLERDATFVFDADDPVLSSWADEAAGRARGFSLRRDAPGCARDGRLWIDGEPLLEVAELPLPGRHQWANALAAALAARAVGADLEAIRAGLRRFRGLPGRHALVAERDGVRFVDDSIATRELSVAAALEASRPPVAWIAGGRDKGADVSALAPLARERVALFVGIGASGPALAERLEHDCPVRVVSEKHGRAAMREAVEIAADALRGRGGTVLLAPLASSFDQFEDYRDRALAFREAVAHLQGEPWTASS